MLWAVILLTVSNIFMTYAWYGHLKTLKESPMWLAILASWAVAFLEYCFQVPANRIGHTTGLSTPNLKILQEIITLVVFAAFTTWFMGEPLEWKHFLCFGLILGAVVVMFAF